MKARRRSAVLAASVWTLAFALGAGAAPQAFAKHASKHKAAAPAHAKHGAAHETEAALPASGGLKVLSPGDVRAYAAAFDATKRGDFDAADDAAARIDNTLLMGRLVYRKLMHPAYVAKADELKAWLKAYKDQPDADKIYQLARKRILEGGVRTGGAPTTAAPATDGLDAPAKPVVDPTWARAEAQVRRLEASAPKAAVDRKQEAAREAFYAGDVKGADTLAVAANDKWIAGLAAFRMERYAEAMSRFDTLSTDRTQNEWVRSAGAYWAARAATASGAPERAPAYLQRAAATPYTFYGLIAERQLGLDPAVTADGMDLGPDTAVDIATATTPSKPIRVAANEEEAGPSATRLIRKDGRARRAAAFAQLGMKTEAAGELRNAAMAADSGAARKTWTSLAVALNAPIASPADTGRAPRARFDVAQFPTPDLDPVGGFTLDKALVYALVRQESRFDTSAVSTAGAHGLMQLMPTTAAIVAGDDKLAADPSPLHDPAINLRLGQDYVARLLTSTRDDILQAVAAYNIGPGALQKMSARMGNADSLLLIESMPGAQTRDFVQKVMANYWIYRNLFGKASPSLSAVASAAKAVTAGLDR